MMNTEEMCSRILNMSKLTCVLMNDFVYLINRSIEKKTLKYGPKRTYRVYSPDIRQQNQRQHVQICEILEHP